jgi:LacI family transcriptional regulator
LVNQLGKSFRSGKTSIMGLLAEDINNPFLANVARITKENAYSEGYKILYCNTENNIKE